MKVLVVGEGASELAGALQALVSRLSSKPLDIDHDRVSRRDIRVHPGKGNGYFKRALRWMMEAERRGYEALVLVIDQDKDGNRIKQFGEAQNHVGVTAIARALGVAIPMFDAWMLADEKALTDVLGRVVSRQKDLEARSNPKEVFRELHQSIVEPRAVAHVYYEIAQVLDIHLLETRCPKGFAPFAARVRAL